MLETAFCSVNGPDLHLREAARNRIGVAVLLWLDDNV